jgi:hypothetical protein
MYVLTDRHSGRPLVADLSGIDVEMRVVSVSKHHVTVEITDRRATEHPEIPRLDGADVPLQLVLSRENAGQLIDILFPAVTGVEVDMDALVHDPNCDCGQCPTRPPEPG